MATTYGSFPGVKVTTAGGGITAVAIGDEENLVIFGGANYQNDGTFDGNDDPIVSAATASLNDPTQINARTEADDSFGEDSELALAMREALANGANIDFLYGVAPTRKDVSDESFSGTSSGTLANAPIVEDTGNVDVEDTVAAATYTVHFTHDGAPSQPTQTDVIRINPLTGQWAADTSSDFEISYKYYDWSTAFSAASNVVDEDETGIYVALTEADSVSSTLQTEVSSLRNDYQLINALSGAEPNDDESVDTDDDGNPDRFDAQYDTGNFSKGSVDQDYYFKFAPVREETNDIDDNRTVLGGVGGLFAGNPINDPIYNDALNGYDALEQSFSKSDADNMRDEEVIPIRSDGTVRVKDNLSTSTSTDWERDFWRRRITDRVILIAKTVGDSIIGDINDEQTRNAAQRQVEAEIRSLVDDRLLKPNTADEDNWFVDVYESSTDSDEVKIDIGFTPYGVVKQIDASVTINA